MRDHAPHDGGMSLVEVVVAMMLLAVVVLAMLPLLLNGIGGAAANATRTSAVQLVAERMELAAAAGPQCADVARLAETRTATDVDGQTMTVTTTVTGTCPAAGRSGTLAVRAIVSANDTRAELASSVTEVYVRGAS